MTAEATPAMFEKPGLPVRTATELELRYRLQEARAQHARLAAGAELNKREAVLWRARSIALKDLRMIIDSEPLDELKELLALTVEANNEAAETAMKAVS